uniref:Tubulin folding cofactor E n=1 Tax=Leptobrachium leishanense TaxID=445787 RepID=A0A8C5MEI8_9ANUR
MLVGYIYWYRYLTFKKFFIFILNSHPSGGSFVRPKKVNFGVDFLTAIRRRYGLKDEETEDMMIGTKTVELVGFDSVHEEQSQLNRLRDISLRECAVSHTGSKDNIYHSCPNITTLNLSKNLLSSWDSLAVITSQLERLENLDLSENRLLLSSNPSSLSGAFLNLRVLSLNRTGLTWSECLMCSPLWPALEELHLASNEFTHLERPVDYFLTLEVLDISNNTLADGSQLHALAYLPRLKQLIVSSNRISLITLPDVQFGETSAMFSSLNSLSIDGNNLSLSTINELSKLKMLHSLNCQNNPLIDSNKTPETVRQLVIAKIRNLKLLNRTEILQQERKGAELDYRKMFGNDWIKAGGNQNPELSNPSKYFCTEHPTYNYLIEKYGVPDDGELKQEQPFALKNQLLTLTFRCPFEQDKKPIEKKLPDTMTIQKVKGLLYRLLKVPGSDLKLSYESSKMEGKEIELENDLKSLQFYSVENGDCVLIEI